MSGRSDFWAGVNLYTGSLDARSVWAEACGSDFTVFAKAYLTPTGKSVESILCPLKCGCLHRRGPVGKVLIRYDCDCDDQTCPCFFLKVADAEGMIFKSTQFYVDLAACLKIDRGGLSYAGQVGSVHLGHLTVDGVVWWVFLVNGETPCDTDDLVAALTVKHEHRPLVVLTPEYAVKSAVILEKIQGRIIGLRDYVTMTHDGTLIAPGGLASRLSSVAECAADDLSARIALKLNGKRFEIADDYTWIMDRRKKKRQEISGHSCQEALRFLVEHGAGTRNTAVRKRDWCAAVWRKLKPGGPWPSESKPIQFFRVREDGTTVQLPFYKDVIRSDGRGLYWLDL